MRLFILVALLYLIVQVSPGPDGSAPACPLKKGDPGAGQEVDPGYNDLPPPDPRTNGHWMVYAIGIDYTDPSGQPKYSATCWTNSDVSTMREVPISAETYGAYDRNPDTGSIPCPE